MNSFDIESNLLTFNPETSEVNPEQEVRKIIQGLMTSDEIPPTKSLHLFHIRGVGNDKFVGGEDKDVVIFQPEFLYLLDIGYPALAAVVLSFVVSGQGDPHFPDFSQYTVRSVQQGGSNRDLLFPNVAGSLLIGTKSDIPDSAIRKELAPYVKTLKLIAPNLYEAEVKPFHEPEIKKNIEERLSFVRYAEQNGIVRLIDFRPGWFVSRVI